MSAVADPVLWHDLECGSYAADLPLWRELAAREAGPVLDVGAGTGRVALDLAGAGHEVVAVDHDVAVLVALRERAGGLPVATVVADACELDLDMRFGLVLLPMQTIQLLGGAERRARCLERAARHVGDRGLLAISIADAFEGFGGEGDMLPVPDMVERAGFVYTSQPVSLRDDGDGVLLERVRSVVTPEGRREEETNVVRLDRLSVAELEREAGACGLRAEPARRIDATDDHVGSWVVMLRGA